MSSDNETSDIEGLIKQLRYSSIPLQRERAAYILANYRDSRVLEALLNAQLNDPNPRVRDASSQALASLITTEEIEEDLVEQIKSKQESEIKDIERSTGGHLFNLSKDFEIIRKGMKKVKFDWKDSLELKQLFKSVDKDRYLQKQPNVRSLINSILLLPIDDSSLGRDVAITLSEILRVSSDETERTTAIGCLNNIITNIDHYTPFFGIAEAYIMLFKASDESDMRIAACKCLEEVIIKKKSLAKLNQYTNDIVKLLTFSYDQKIREIALFAYPDLVLSQDEKIPYLIDIIIGIVRATYEDQLREMGLKAFEALLLRGFLSEENVQRIIKILKSHHKKNIRTRAIELFTQIYLQTRIEIIDTAISALFEIVINTKEEDICYTAIQNIEKYSFSKIEEDKAKIIFPTLVDITTQANHPFLAFRAYNIVESVFLNHPIKFTKSFASTYVECLKLHKDIGVMEQILLTYSELTTSRELIPRDVKQYIKTLLYLSPDPEITESLVSVFKELMLSDKGVVAEKIINKLIDIAGKDMVKDDMFWQLTHLNVEDFF